ncbi:MAG: response regulator [Microthrixaceae bacterium]|nr:response regulator [Microthrixaceae bacterium]
MKVLLVEDDVRIATAVQRGLCAEGFTVEVALDGEEGLWRATEGTYDLYLLDLMLPGRNGFQICAALREAGDWTPILVLTAKAGEFDETEALDTGADDYLTKPFSFPVLVSRVRAAAAHRESRSGSGVGR